MPRSNLDKDLKNPYVTIYITNHNYGSFIDKSIKSALNQTYSNYEILIIDDGSTDDSRKKIEKYSNNKKIKIIYKKRSGLIHSNNLAIKISNGKFITRLDADDWLDPNFLQVMVNTAIRDKKIAMVFCNYYLANYKGEIIDQYYRHDFKKVTLKDQPAHGACSLIKTDSLKKIGGYDEQFKCQDGVDLWFKLIKKFKIKQVKLPLFFYRQHSKSLSKNRKEILNTKNKIIKKHTRNLKNRFKKIIAIIPIRDENSEKNFIALKKFNSKTVIEILLDKIQKVNQVTKIVVSTPDKNIQKFIKKKYKNKIIIHDRIRKLARVNTPIEPTIKSVFRNLNEKTSKKKLALVTNVINPLIKIQDYEAGIDLMKLFDLDTVLGVCKENDLLYSHDGNSLIQLKQSSTLREKIMNAPTSIMRGKAEGIKSKEKVFGNPFNR